MIDNSFYLVRTNRKRVGTPVDTVFLGSRTDGNETRLETNGANVIYRDPVSGNDANPGTLAQPVQSQAAAEALVVSNFTTVEILGGGTNTETINVQTQSESGQPAQMAAGVAVEANISNFDLLGGITSTTAITLFNVSCSLNITTDVIDADGGLILDKCKLINADTGPVDISGSGLIELQNTVLQAPLNIDYTGAVADGVKINKSTIVGNITLNNSGKASTLYEFRDFIIEGDFTSANSTDPPLLESGNLRGIPTNFLIGQISQVNPLFVDPSTADYRLQRQSGYTGTPGTQDSALIGAATFATVNGVPAELGAHTFDDSGVAFQFLNAYFLPKPIQKDAVSITRRYVANVQTGLNGEPDVFNQPERATEFLEIQYSALTYNRIDGKGTTGPGQFIEFIESLQDTRCFISFFPGDFIDVPSVTVNGAQGPDVASITIAPATVLPGAILQLDGQEYFIQYTIPSTQPTTQLVLNRPLETSVSDLQTLNLKFPFGSGVVIGEFVYVPSGQKTVKLPAAITDEIQGGLKLQFVRKV